MAYSIDPIQDNCYPGTTVLVNKLHIHDEATLQEAEALATYVNASKLEQCPLEGVFDFAHYKAIHQFLFSDLYDWADPHGEHQQERDGFLSRRNDRIVSQADF